MSGSDRFVGLLAATVIGVYALLLAGATSTVADAAAACPALPACGDGLALPTTASGGVAVAHRGLAVVVGVGVVAAAVVGWLEARLARVRLALAAVAVCYPLQAVVGGTIAISAPNRLLSAAHLGLGIGIFSALVAALAWTLEQETEAADATGTTEETGGRPPVDPPAGGDGEVTGGHPTLPDRPLARLRSIGLAYLRLTKPRLMWLLCLVAGAAMALAGVTDPRTVVATLGGGVLAIGASGTFNHVFERDLDRRMARTNDRPLAVDMVSPVGAAGFGIALAVGALLLFWTVNPLVAVLGLVAILFYSVVYTLLLKPNTDWNTVIGGAAGALPALIGWAAVTGTVGTGGLALAAVVFLWTPAHFYNLALAYREDYERAGLPMLPVVRGAATTRKHILYYLAAALSAAAALAHLRGLDGLYAVVVVAAGGGFLAAVVALHYERTDAAALRAFHASNAFLGGLLAAVVVDAAVV